MSILPNVFSSRFAARRASAATSRSSDEFRWVNWILAIYFAVQAVVRISLSSSVRIDEAQQFVVNQWLAWGYDAQPPLYNWIQYGVFDVFGTSVASLAVLKNILLFLVYFAYHQLARLLLEDKRLAAVATLSLLTIPQMFWQAQRDLTHTVGTLLAVTAFIYFVVKTIRKPTFTSYAMMGLWAGLGMLTKYNFVLIIASVFVAVVFHPQGRSRLLDKRFVMTLALAILVFLPHAVWMLSNMDLVLTSTVATMSEQGQGGKLSDIGHGVVELIKTSIVIIAPTAAIFLIVFRRPFLQSLRFKSEWVNFFERIFLSTVAILFALILVTTLTEFRDRWLLPFLFLVPLYFCLKLEAAGAQNPSDIKKSFYVPFGLMIALPLILTAGTIFPKLFDSYQHLNTPYGAFLKETIAAEGKQPVAVVTTAWLKAGNIRANMPDTAVISTAYPASDLDRQALGNGPILLVWNERDGHASSMPDELKRWLTAKFGNSITLPAQNDAAIPYYYGKDPDRFHFGYAWFYPAAG
ncbi:MULTISPECIES: glycosyltransferase family 39 protein [unclassified Rhizobium]|uniref:glycosyltransferase family 39 protein n=1 Tax=unclassified Rhizobium TaxID=2613769 RepID=UPI000DDF3F77|nr:MULTISPECIES: glycosyltransferase family 39 protein [unclassified Rhizobium]MBB3286939.1 4-amino-4-deoxy-L-arabinose transferase-like glycosyltransferase [Rhizobium sp. BK252]MBB3401679.1 4-amino-4-deoxy-L-arabinose transferase-like glycosyltransferase [Rhizobium sp. BK289]MBB3414377.1 4-amino-4-deoxy-L-arabinose transferase-like glycosyltransferase [Rhizobium sp. BK284]MBB3482265.1 4-amino-4-deoxy-L-arabinose transferase-like glycosyltransferase [Rhizobium sp. BK347]MDK4718435.1 glycosyltr